MKHLSVLLVLLAGCALPDGLGGQEGEPIAPPTGGLPPGAEPNAPPPADELDADGAMENCLVAESCAGDGWCADYSADTAPPDPQAQCEGVGGTWSEAPCEIEQNVGFCTDDESDPCTIVWLYADLAELPDTFCDDLEQAFVTPRG